MITTRQIVKGATSQILLIFIPDATNAVGKGMINLAHNSSGLTCYYKRDTGTASVAVTLATITTLGTWETGGFKKIDDTNMPGWYEFHPPNAALASGASEVTFCFRGVTDMFEVNFKVELIAADLQNATNLGLSLVPANVTQLSGDSTAADNAEAFFDGTGYAGTGNTIPTVTTVGTVSALAANSLTAAAAAADLGTELANALLDLANGIETSITPRQALRLALAVLCGVAEVTGNDVEFMRRDGTTTAATVTTAVGGNRTVSTIGTL